MKNSKEAFINFKRIILVLFLIFLINYFQAESNNNLVTKKTVMTEKQIEEFESDIKNGEFIDIKNYTEKTYVDTSNPISNAAYELGNGISEFFGVKVVDFINFIGNFIS